MDQTYLLQNKYSLWYLHFVSIFQQRNWKKCKTNVSHHITPDSFFKNSKRKHNRDGWLDGDPHIETNLIVVSEKEHFQLHWLLCYCFYGPAKRKCANAFKYISSKHKSARFYSIARKIWLEFNRGENHYSHIPSIDKICEYCSTPFSVKPNAIKQKFCSGSCRAKARKGKVEYKSSKITKECPNCRLLFRVSPSNKNRVCCSLICARAIETITQRHTKGNDRTEKQIQASNKHKQMWLEKRCLAK